MVLADSHACVYLAAKSGRGGRSMRERAGRWVFGISSHQASLFRPNKSLGPQSGRRRPQHACRADLLACSMQGLRRGPHAGGHDSFEGMRAGRRTPAACRGTLRHFGGFRAHQSVAAVGSCCCERPAGREPPAVGSGITVASGVVAGQRTASTTCTHVLQTWKLASMWAVSFSSACTATCTRSTAGPCSHKWQPPVARGGRSLASALPAQVSACVQACMQHIKPHALAGGGGVVQAA